MTTPFAFVPRVVSKYSKEWQGITRPPSPSPPPDPTTDDDDEHESTEKAFEPAHSKQSTIPLDIASLISLALSEYNIWLDTDLRWKLDACLQDDVCPDDAGFVPINYLLRRAPFRGALPLSSGHPEPSEAEVVKALRAHAGRTLEVRMRLPPITSASSAASASVSSVWYGTSKTSRKKDVGGYEVRRRDWATLRDRLSRGWMRARWDDLTAYMECIPPQYRSIGGIARFAEALLSDADGNADAEVVASVEPCTHVQCVALPPHYLDKPGDAPKCKGYALVMFSTKPHLEAVLRAWPWKRRIPRPDDDASPVIEEALKYGLRAISKARWDALNEEYLACKRALVDEVACAESGTIFENRSEPSTSTSPHPRAEMSEIQTRPQAQTPMRTTSSSPYPFDCLVFVRNVHPDTNKTMLKSLFMQAFQDPDEQSASPRCAPMAGLDYVDFNKGMDTCYLRLASPSHTTRLLAYFDTHPKTQMHGLDATGRTPLADDKLIMTERMHGKKEELYWEKVPEKVRRQAVESVIQGQLAVEAGSAAPIQSKSNGDGGSQRKKRTRKC